ncbi:Fatty acid desaturase 4 [Spatholobus suberectus]|nr:Fatty acid desaturase 4 [Spatholobus suberectus]
MTQVCNQHGLIGHGWQPSANFAHFLGRVHKGCNGFEHAIDNYGDGSTPIVGAQIEAFQGHHKWPLTIIRHQFANNLHALARAVTFTVLPIALVCHDPIVQGFVGVCSDCIMFSQQFMHGTQHEEPTSAARGGTAEGRSARVTVSACRTPPATV